MIDLIILYEKSFILLNQFDENRLKVPKGKENQFILDYDEAKNIPTCPKCGAVARPNILMFDDGDWNWNRAQTQKKKYIQFLEKNEKSKIAIIEIGAGTAIPTVRHTGETITNVFDAKLIRINPREYKINKNIGFSIPFGGLEGISKVLGK